MFEDVELNGELSSATEMKGAVIFLSSVDRQSCHGTETNLKETCALHLQRKTGKLKPFVLVQLFIN